MSHVSEHPFRPDYAVAPGKTLRRRLKEISVSQAELASRSGLSTKHVNQIMQGVAPITHETALVLERVTGMPAGLWNRLEADYREALLRARHRELSSEDRRWLGLFPVSELQRRGYLPRERDQARLLDALLNYFGVADRSAWERMWTRPVASLKQSKAFSSDPGAVAAWLRLGELDARDVVAASFDAADFREALQLARGLTRLQRFADELVDACKAAGVVVVFVPEIGKSRVSGAAWWANPDRAVIQLSDRYKHEDNLWFAFFHEAGHVLLHSKRQTFIDDGTQVDELENEANRFAASTLIPPAAAKELPSLATEGDVERFASEVGVSPGIIVGRLHNDGLWDWRKGNRLRRHLRILEA
jgi:HTH-type transcriptional regulator / antitoxin HigA